MTNAMATLDLASAAAGLPAYLQAYRSEAGKNLLVGGAGVAGNRIGLKGNRFRLVVAGVEESVIDDNFLDLFIVGAAPGVSRIYYADKWDPGVKVAPTCYSKDGTAPADDVVNKQSAKCANCPMNVKGSAVTDTGGKTKACSYFKRLAVVMPYELEQGSPHVFRLDAKGMSIFGESKPGQNKFSIGEYGKKLATRGIDPAFVVTRFTFDTDSSVPKLLLSPSAHATEAQAALIHELLGSDEVAQALDVTSQTVDLSGEQAPEEPVTPAAAPAAAQAPKASPAAAPAVAARPAATAAPAVRPTGAPSVTKVALPAAAPAKAAAPAVQVVAQAAPAATAEDDDLAALIAQLESE